MEQFLFVLVCALGLILLAGAEHKGHEHGQHPNHHFVGLFENDHPLYGFFVSHVCEERETKAIYWGSGTVDENGVETTSFIGRDVDGAEDLGGGVFQISGETYTILTGAGVGVGTWEMNYDSNTDVYQFSTDIPGLFADTNFPTKVNGRAHSRHTGHGGHGGGGGRRLLSHQFVREEYRCFMPYGGPLNTEYPQAYKTVESGKDRVGEDEKTDLVLYRPTEAGAGCNAVLGEAGVDISLGNAYEGRLHLLRFTSATQTVCPFGSAIEVVVAQNLLFEALTCVDGSGFGTQNLFELDQSGADWHSCPIGP